MEIFLLLFVIACIIAACTDFLFYKIPNWIVLFVLFAYLLKAGVMLFTGTEVSYFYIPLISFAAVFVIGFLLFALRVLGAGDAKLLAVSSLWMAEINTIQFILLTLIAGGVLAIFYLKLNQGVDFIRNILLSKIVGKYGVVEAPAITKNAVPYAIAIAGGVIWVLALNGWR